MVGFLHNFKLAARLIVSKLVLVMNLAKMLLTVDVKQQINQSTQLTFLVSVGNQRSHSLHMTSWDSLKCEQIGKM
jgi:hypothetical protein